MGDGWRKLITGYARKSESNSNPPTKKVIRNGKIVTVGLDENECSLSKGLFSVAEVPVRTKISASKGGQNAKVSEMKTDSAKFSDATYNIQHIDSQRDSKGNQNLGRYVNFRDTKLETGKGVEIGATCTKSQPPNAFLAHKTDHVFSNIEQPDIGLQTQRFGYESFQSDEFLSDRYVDKVNSEVYGLIYTHHPESSTGNPNIKTSVTGRYINALIGQKSTDSWQNVFHQASQQSQSSVGINYNPASSCDQIFYGNSKSQDRASVEIQKQASGANSQHHSQANMEVETMSGSNPDNSNEITQSISRTLDNKPTIAPRISIQMSDPGVIVISPSSKILCDLLSKYPRNTVQYDPKAGTWRIDPCKYAEIRPLFKKNFRFQDIPAGLLKLYLQFAGSNISSTFESEHFPKQKNNNCVVNISTSNKDIQSHSGEIRMPKQAFLPLQSVSEHQGDVYPTCNMGEKRSQNSCRTIHNDQSIVHGTNTFDLHDPGRDQRFKEKYLNNSSGNAIRAKNLAIRTQIKNISVSQYLKVPLLDFQRIAVAQAIAWGGRILLADEMGLGKTLQALACALHYRAEWPCLVLAPASLVGVWVQAFREFADIELSILKEKADLSAKAYVCSYDMAAKIFKHSYSTIRVIIADEAHFLKNPKTNRCSSLLSLLQKANRLFLLSGTPATSRPSELYTSLIALRPKVFKSFKEFGERYCGGVQKGKYADWRGCSHSTELLFFLKEIFMIRRTKADVLSELPLKSRVQVVLEVTSKELDQGTLDLYQGYSHNGSKIPETLMNYITESSKGAKKLGKPAKVDKSIIQMYNEAAERKLPVVLKYIRKFLLRNTKTVIFAQHHVMLDEIQKTFGHIKHIRIDGKTPVHIRQRLVENFQNEPEIQIALLSITTCGTGLTLTAANAAIFTELYWNPGTLLQAEDRIHRIGQTKEVTIYYLTATRTVDEVVWPLLTKKMAVLEKCGVGNNEFKDIQSDEGFIKITDFCTIEKYDSAKDSVE